ncbi:pyocin knob domain-containing protein [Achromobacter xylosoxidans]
MASISTASAGKHFPVAQAGHLEVLSAAGQGAQPVSGAVQVYRALNSNSAYTRSLVGDSWTPWKKIATTEDINEASGSYMTHVRLAGAGVDLNRCYLGESYYTWDAGETMTAGMNFPPAAPAAGVLYTAVASTVACCRRCCWTRGRRPSPACTRAPGTARAGAWGAWRISGGLSGIAQLPKADAGEVYVDGIGWMAWDAAAPAGYYLKPGQRNVRLEITASGSVPVPAYVRRVYVRAIGGGGGGAYSHQGATENSPSYGTVYIGSGGGAGGGAGEYYEGELAVAPGIPLAITIGAGGGPGSSTADGTAGGQTLIQQGASVLKSLSGGGGGGRASYTFGGVSGAGGGQPGGTGTAWFAGLSGYASPPGNGGGGGFSPFGAGGMADIDRVPQLCRRRRLSAAFPRLGRGRWRRRWFVGRRQWLLRGWRGGSLRHRHPGVLNDTRKHAYP